MPSQPDLLSIVEMVYEVEKGDEATWLRSIIERATTVVGRQHGAYGLTYDASNIDACTFSDVELFNVDDARVKRVLRDDCQRLYRENPDLVDAIFRKIGYAPSSKLPSQEKLAGILQKLGAAGVREILGINGVNVDGRGAHIGILVKRSSSVLGADVLARLSTHLGASFRLRRRLRAHGTPSIDQADAILEPSGKITHAVREAKVKGAREELASAAVRLDRLRAAHRRRDPERALGAWRALVDGRWSLVDHFEHDGRRYVLAQRNDPEIGPFELLTDRERQVVALAAVGHSNKMIGYELGIAISTVGVLLTRASRKVGASSRRELVTSYDKRMKS